jgi:hypothetical protein
MVRYVLNILRENTSWTHRIAEKPRWFRSLNWIFWCAWSISESLHWESADQIFIGLVSIWFFRTRSAFWGNEKWITETHCCNFLRLSMIFRILNWELNTDFRGERYALKEELSTQYCWGQTGRNFDEAWRQKWRIPDQECRSRASGSSSSIMGHPQFEWDHRWRSTIDLGQLIVHQTN